MTRDFVDFLRRLRPGERTRLIGELLSVVVNASDFGLGISSTLWEFVKFFESLPPTERARLMDDLLQAIVTVWDDEVVSPQISSREPAPSRHSLSFGPN
jgi:hypothetical protein